MKKASHLDMTNDQEGRNEQKIVRKSCVEFSFSVIYRQAISA